MISGIMSAVQERLKSIADEGAFGAGRTLRVLNASDHGKGEQFQSVLLFLQVDLIPDKGKLIKIPVVVKTQIADLEARQSNDTIVQFFNEVVMYKKIIPTLGGDGLGICPKMFYGEASGELNSDRDIVVIEDLRPQGYKVVQETWLNYDHINIAMKKLGQFHGLSYRFKKSSPEKLQDLVNSLRPKTRILDSNFEVPSIRRAFRQLLDDKPIYSVLSKAYRKLTSKSIFEITECLQKAEEPFAVFVHGDFNKNNVVYSYDESGKVIDMKMFDFAMSKYGDPTTDISFCLYLNTSPELRTNHWNDFLEAYWSGVTSIIEDPGFSFDEFLMNVAKKAIVGLVPCSFYLPLLLNPGSLDSVDYPSMTTEEQAEFFANLGGDASTSATSAIVRHLQDSGYLEEFLLNFKLD